MAGDIVVAEPARLLGVRIAWVREEAGEVAKADCLLCRIPCAKAMAAEQAEETADPALQLRASAPEEALAAAMVEV